MWNSPRAHPWHVSGSSAGRQRQRRTSRIIRVGLLPDLQAPRDGWERGDDGGDGNHAHARGGVEAWRQTKGTKGQDTIDEVCVRWGYE